MYLLEPQALKVPTHDYTTTVLQLHNTSLFPITRLPLSVDTLAIIPKSHQPTLMLDRQLGFCYQQKTTRQLIRQYLKSQIIDYSQMCLFCDFFAIRQKRPLINGECQFLPLNGTTHGNSAWIGLHYVRDFELSRKYVHFQFLNQQELHLPYRGRNLEQQIHFCAAISRLQRDCLCLCAQHFNYKIALQSRYVDSVIHRYDTCQCEACQRLPQTPEALIELIRQHEKNKSNYILKMAKKWYQDEYDDQAFQWYSRYIEKILKQFHRLNH